MLASQYDHPEVVQLLLKAGANLNSSDNFGWTALMYASHYGHVEVVQLLLNAGANPNAVNNDVNGEKDCCAFRPYENEKHEPQIC